MKASFSKSGREALLVEAHDLEAIYAALSSLCADVSITLKCRDTIERKTDDIAELLGFENTQSREIRELWFHAHSSDWKSSAHLKLANSLIETYWLKIEGPEDQVSNVSDSLIEKIGGMKPWYAFLAKASLLGIGASITAFLVSTVFILSKIMPHSGTSEPSSPETWQQNALVLALTFSLLLGPPILGFILDRLKAKIFPMVTFAFGQGAKRHHTRELIRTVVVLGFFVSLVAGLVTFGITELR
jgi:hypothetical protein